MSPIYFFPILFPYNYSGSVKDAIIKWKSSRIYV